MCKYSSYAYKNHFVCFHCRKGFKKDLCRHKLNVNEHKCPECGTPMALFGYDFKVPAKKETDQWKKIEYLYHNGYHFFCCCPGPGYAPQNLEEAKILVSGVEQKKEAKTIAIRKNFQEIARRTKANRRKLEDKRLRVLIRKQAGL